MNEGTPDLYCDCDGCFYPPPPPRNLTHWPGGRRISELISACISPARGQARSEPHAEGHPDCSAPLASVLDLSLQGLLCSVVWFPTLNRSLVMSLYRKTASQSCSERKHPGDENSHIREESQHKCGFEAGPLGMGEGGSEGRTIVALNFLQHKYIL